MATYNKQILSKQADELGFIRDTLEKMIRLSVVIKFITDDPFLSSNVVLKGGTAINLTILSLPRLSVDIDLDFSNNCNKEDMMKSRKDITDTIRRYMEAEGYELSEKTRYSHSLDSFYYSYINSGGIKDNIKIEINYSLRSHVLPYTTKQIVTMGVFNETSILTVAPIEIFASKITALLTRTAARDLYDVNNMIVFRLFNDIEISLLRKCAIFYYTISSDELPKKFDITKINRLTYNRIRTDLQPVLRKKEKFNLPSAQKCVEHFLNELFILENNEEKYLDYFRNKEYRPELLFEDINILDRVKNHPMALWKCK